MANILLDVLRQMLVGGVADKAREEASPYVDNMMQALQQPQQAITPNARMDDQGYPTMSQMLPAETAPYRPSATLNGQPFKAEPVAPTTLRETISSIGDNYQAPVAGGTPYEPVPADRVLTAEEEARQAAYNPSQPIDYTDMDARLQQQFNQNELDRTIAAENSAIDEKVNNFIREYGREPINLETVINNTSAPIPMDNLIDELDPEKIAVAVAEDDIDPNDLQEMAKATGGMYNLTSAATRNTPAPDVEHSVFNPDGTPNYNTTAARGLFDMTPATPKGEAPEGEQEDSFLAEVGKGLADYFGDEERMTRMALAFNSLRYQPDQALAQVLGKRLETLAEARRATAVAQGLRKKGLDKAADYVELTKDTKGYYKVAVDNAWRLMTPAEKTKAGIPESQVVQVNDITGGYKGVGGGGINIMPQGSTKANDLLAEDDFKLIKSARNAKKNLEKLDDIVRLIDEGKPATGYFSDVVTELNRVMSALGGKEAADSVRDTQLLSSLLGSDVFAMLDVLGLGARGLDTPAERDFLISVMTGDRKMDAATIKEMTRLRAKYTMQAVDAYNERLSAGDFDYIQRKDLKPIDISDYKKGRLAIAPIVSSSPAPAQPTGTQPRRQPKAGSTINAQDLVNQARGLR
jgi:hypothetical protein